LRSVKNPTNTKMSSTLVEAKSTTAKPMSACKDFIHLTVRVQESQSSVAKTLPPRAASILRSIGSMLSGVHRFDANFSDTVWFVASHRLQRYGPVFGTATAGMASNGGAAGKEARIAARSSFR